MLAIGKADIREYAPMKQAFIVKFCLTPEKYRVRFRDSQKLSNQSWADFVDYSGKGLDVWVKGSKVSDYDGLYNLIMKEHMFSNYIKELRQHRIDFKLTVP